MFSGLQPLTRRQTTSVEKHLCFAQLLWNLGSITPCASTKRRICSNRLSRSSCSFPDDPSKSLDQTERLERWKRLAPTTTELVHPYRASDTHTHDEPKSSPVLQSVECVVDKQERNLSTHRTVLNLLCIILQKCLQNHAVLNIVSLSHR